jgi:hypothetical protein
MLNIVLSCVMSHYPGIINMNIIIIMIIIIIIIIILRGKQAVPLLWMLMVFLWLQDQLGASLFLS